MTNSNYDFEKDLPLSESAEYAILNEINKKYPDAYKKEGYCKGFDIVVPSANNKLVEIKYDRQTLKTGNYFIETRSNDISSGINTTRADWYVFVDDRYFIWVSIIDLKALADNYKEITYPPRGKDCSRSGKLIGRREIHRLGKLIKHNFNLII